MQTKIKNETVSQLIERLKKINPDAIICKVNDCNLQPNEEMYETVQFCTEVKSCHYSNDSGDVKNGAIVVFS